MSTHTRRATEPTPTTDAANDADTAATTPPATAPPAGDADARTPQARTADARTPDTAESWVARCQSQFDAGGTDRLRNLADAENHAMPDGV